MSRRSSEGPLVISLAKMIRKLAADPEYRFRWLASIVVVSAAVLMLAASWWLSEGGGSFRQGAPAPRTYFAHSRMKIVDENATRALREQRIAEIVGVVVKDRAHGEEAEGMLVLLERGEYGEALPDSLAVILEALGEDSRNRVISVSVMIAEELIGSPEMALDDDDPIWQKLSLSPLSVPEQNLAFQILDHILGSSFKEDPQATLKFKQQVASEVVPVERIIGVGETIAREGQLISPEMAIILRAQGYPEREIPWKTLLFVFLATTLWIFWMWWYTGRRDFSFDRREWLFIIFILITGWLAMFVSSRFAGNVLGIIALAGWAYLGLPGSFSFHLLIWGGVIGSVIASGSSSMDLMLSVFATVLTASLGYVLMTRIDSRWCLIRKLLLLGLGLSFGVYVIMWGLYLPSGWKILVTYVFSAVVWVAVTIGALPLWEKFFDILTPIRLVDLTHPSHPLLKRLQIEAPGTYHHSIMVGTLAEAAAQGLKMNALLVRAGASFHDVGKLKRPQFFVENQQTGHNPHDELSPTLSALIIISHVREGLEIARQYGIPQKIRVFISEHHGTTCLGYFFKKASITEPDLQMDQFCYPGNRPASRESAVVMLADSVEAAVRAAAGDIRNPKELEEVVSNVIETKISESQLDLVPLTLQDITRIKIAFSETLKHMYHTRRVSPVSEETKTEEDA
ncbi:MAG TPA: HDIG domain-containing protein [Thermovirgaceae bacterium]|nr:HDIG domain-containing protein [Thermovirgaceae bacterium]